MVHASVGRDPMYCRHMGFGLVDRVAYIMIGLDNHITCIYLGWLLELLNSAFRSYFFGIVLNCC